MTQELREQLLKRLKSFLWRLASYIVVSGLALLVESLQLYNLDPAVIAIIALICGEITKFVNTYGKDK